MPHTPLYPPPPTPRATAAPGGASVRSSGSGQSALPAPTETSLAFSPMAPPGPPDEEVGSRALMAYEFGCSRCSLIQSKDDMASGMQNRKANSLFCVSCRNNYKTLCRRWSKNPAIKRWWEAKDATAQRDWYRQHRGLDMAQGGKRSGRELQIDFSEMETNYTGEEQKRRTAWQPYSEWRMQFLVQGFTDAQCQVKWKQALVDPASKVMRDLVTNEPLIGSFCGIVSEVVEGRTTSTSMSKRRKIDSSADIATAAAVTKDVQSRGRERMYAQCSFQVLDPPVPDELITAEVVPAPSFDQWYRADDFTGAFDAREEMEKQEAWLQRQEDLEAQEFATGPDASAIENNTADGVQGYEAIACEDVAGVGRRHG